MSQDTVIIDPDGTTWRRIRNADARLVNGQVYVRQPAASPARAPLITFSELVRDDHVELRHHQLGALQGTIVAADGTLLYSLFTEPRAGS